jgi:NADPH:quinone reductase
MTATMGAVVLNAPGPPEELRFASCRSRSRALGWVLIRVKALGINRSELHTRLGLGQGVTFPRVCSASRRPASSPLHPEASSSKASKSPR